MARAVPAERTLGDLARDAARLVDVLCVEADWGAAGDVVAIVLPHQAARDLARPPDARVTADCIPKGTMRAVAHVRTVRILRTVSG